MSKTILLADDSVTIQKVIELTFMDQDYEVEAVSTGDEALSKLDSVDPDLVIADVHMPGADGYEVARRTKERDASVPVLLLVGTFEPFDEGDMADSGADSHLKKPFDSQELLQLVERLLESAEDAASEAAPADEAQAEASGPQAVPEPPESPPESPPEPPVEASPADDASAATEPAASGAGFPAGKDRLRDEAEVQVVDIGTDEGEEVTWGNLDLDTPQEEVAPTAVEEPEEVEEVEEPEEAVPFTLEEESPAETDQAEPDAAPFRLREPEEVELEAEPTLAETGPPGGTAGAAGEEPSVPGMESSAPMEPEGSVPEPATAEEEGTRPEAAVREASPPEEAAQQPPARQEEAPAETAAEVAGSAAAATGLSDEDVERIARRVAELLGAGAVKEVAWEVVPDLAEVVIKDRIRQLEGQVE